MRQKTCIQKTIRYWWRKSKTTQKDKEKYHVHGLEESVLWKWLYYAKQGKPFNITVIQVYAPTSNAEEAEAERIYEDLQDLLELTPKKDVLFIIGDCNAKVGSQETLGVIGKFGLGIRNEAGQRLIEFCQENDWS